MHLMSWLTGAVALGVAPSLTPVDVVERQLAALQNGDVETCFQFASPANKRATGPWQRFEMMVRQTPAYAPLIGCSKYAVVGAVAVSDAGYRCRVRVWPASGASVPFGVTVPALGVKFSAPVLDYDWALSRQPEDAVDRSLAGCWMVDSVLPDASPREVWDAEFARRDLDAEELGGDVVDDE